MSPNAPVQAQPNPTLEEYRRYVHYHIHRKGKGLRPGIVIFYVAVFLTILLIVFTLAQNFDLTLLLLAIMLALLPVYRAIVLNVRIKRKYEEFKRLKLAAVLEFRDDAIKAVMAGNGMNGTTEIKYEAIARVVERREAFYLYLSENSAQLIPAKSITGASPGEFARYLRGKVGARYFELY